MHEYKLYAYYILMYKKRGAKMKEGIYPNYHEVEVICACGETFKTKSTVNGDVVRVEICNKCHPFYTGKRKMVDSSGRVDKFKKKFNME